MAGSKAALWAPLIAIGILITTALIIGSAVVLSLIPVYINNKAVDPSTATELGLLICWRNE